MRLRILPFLAIFALACGDKDQTTDDSVASDDSGADDSATSGDDTGGGGDDSGEAPTSDATGNIDLRDGSAEATAVVAKAFSFWSANRTFVYTSANPEATCALITELFDPRGDTVDKNKLFLPGTCNMSYSYYGAPPLATYDIQTMTGAIVGAQCAYGDGTWEYDANASFPDYYYTGEYYEASSWKGSFDINFLDSDQEALILVVAIREWEGTFPYSTTRAGEYKASGSINGTIVTEHCAGLERSGWF